MGLRDLFGKTTPTAKRGRGKAKSAEEKAALLRQAFLRDLKRTDPELYAEIMLAEVMPKRREVDPIRQLLGTLRELRDGGLIDDPRKAGEDDWKDVLKSVAPALGPLLMQFLMANQQAQAAAAQQQQPALVAAPPSPTSISEEAEPPHTEQPQEVPVSIVSRYVIGQLNGKEPEEAAQWLIGQPQARGFVQQLASQPDEELLVFLSSAVQQAPDFAGLVAWLRERPQWLVETVRAVRRLTQEDAEKKGSRKSRIGML